ncbi:hypothetical protein GUJ93_ZPchr0004g38795 [Zizania palustris]|uniref:Uncharacterized protein n=1 Tax=Zizania palustris TaxID=103762 RepID=A0A8J5VZG8_ZIZPA|nr:hypothetical protein GUJ93_ZPchr0004g38795 [Zizania palustris]
MKLPTGTSKKGRGNKSGHVTMKLFQARPPFAIKDISRWAYERANSSNCLLPPPPSQLLSFEAEPLTSDSSYLSQFWEKDQARCQRHRKG